MKNGVAHYMLLRRYGVKRKLLCSGAVFDCTPDTAPAGHFALIFTASSTPSRLAEVFFGSSSAMRSASSG